MSEIMQAINKIAADFTITPYQILDIAEKFRFAMERKLSGHPSPFKMLPSYLERPSGHERGVYLALDFGGTNVRIMLVELRGNGSYKILTHSSSPLKDPQGSYDYTSAQTTAEDLFLFLAERIGKVAVPGQSYILGHTFSFPSRQTDINNAELIHWTKEIKTAGMAGRNITDLLTGALAKLGLNHITPVAIINDTIGTLLTAAFQNDRADIGSICGTGLNTAYLEASPVSADGPMLINIESGNFAELPLTVFDAKLDAASELPGLGRLEKAGSGRYLGELLLMITTDLMPLGLLAGTPRRRFVTPVTLNGADIAAIIADHTPDMTATERWLAEHHDISGTTGDDRQALKAIASLIVRRSARMVAASYLGILRHIDPELSHPHHIAVDGSLYEKMPGYSAIIQDTLDEALGDKSARVTIGLTKNGSAVGAAIAAAISGK